MGESVKIAIPYSVILDIDRSTAMDFSETVEVKVVDRDNFTMDSYFFAYFQNLPEALAQIREVVKTYKTGGSALGAGEPTTSLAFPAPAPSSLTVTDTTLQRSSSATSRLGVSSNANGAIMSSSGRGVSLPMDEEHSSSSQTGTGFSFTSLLRPSVPSLPNLPNLLRRTSSPQEMTSQEILRGQQVDPAHDYTHVLPDLRASPVRSVTPSSASTDSATSALTMRPSPDVVQPGQTHPQMQGLSQAHHGANTAPAQTLRDHGLTYPPSIPPLPPTIETTPSEQAAHNASTSPQSHRTSWSGSMPSWLKAPSRRLFSISGGGSGSTGSGNGSLGSAPLAVGDLPAVMEQTTVPEGAAEEEQHRDGDMSASNHLGFSILETPQGFAEHGHDAAITEKFRKQFALDEKEQLIGCKLTTFVLKFSALTSCLQMSLDPSSAFYPSQEGCTYPPTIYAFDHLSPLVGQG